MGGKRVACQEPSFLGSGIIVNECLNCYVKNSKFAYLDNSFELSTTVFAVSHLHYSSEALTLCISGESPYVSNKVIQQLSFSNRASCSEEAVTFD